MKTNTPHHTPKQLLKHVSLALAMSTTVLTAATCFESHEMNATLEQQRHATAAQFQNVHKNLVQEALDDFTKAAQELRPQGPWVDQVEAWQRWFDSTLSLRGPTGKRLEGVDQGTHPDFEAQGLVSLNSMLTQVQAWSSPNLQDKDLQAPTPMPWWMVLAPVLAGAVVAAATSRATAKQGSHRSATVVGMCLLGVSVCYGALGGVPTEAGQAHQKQLTQRAQERLDEDHARAQWGNLAVLASYPQWLSSNPEEQSLILGRAGLSQLSHHGAVIVSDRQGRLLQDSSSRGAPGWVARNGLPSSAQETGRSGHPSQGQGLCGFEALPCLSYSFPLGEHQVLTMARGYAWNAPTVEPVAAVGFNTLPGLLALGFLGVLGVGALCIDTSKRRPIKRVHVDPVRELSVRYRKLREKGPVAES